MWGTANTQNCESLRRDNEYYRDEIDRRDREDEERREREYATQDERRRQLHQEFRESLCYASSWEDAFTKAIYRFGQEAGDERQDLIETGDTFDTYFTDELHATKRARLLYEDAQRDVQPEIEKLESEIEKLRQSARNQAANQLEKEFPKSTVISALRDNDYSYLVNW